MIQSTPAERYPKVSYMRPEGTMEYYTDQTRPDIWSVAKEPIAMFEFTKWHASFPDFFICLRHYTDIGNQLLLSNDRNRVLEAVLGLSQDGASTNLFDNCENRFKRDL
jgi:hypothetical protein